MADILSILQRKLDIDAENASSQLSAYVEFVRARAKDDEGLEIQDLGRFQLHGSDLTFEPEEALVAAVNYRYRSLPIMTASGEILVTEPSAEDSPSAPDIEAPVVAAAPEPTPEQATELVDEPEEVVADEEVATDAIVEDEVVTSVEPDAEEEASEKAVVEEVATTETTVVHPVEAAPEPKVEPEPEPEAEAEPEAEPEPKPEAETEKAPVPAAVPVVAESRKRPSPAIIYGIPVLLAVIAAVIWIFVVNTNAPVDPQIADDPIAEETDDPSTSVDDNPASIDAADSLTVDLPAETPAISTTEIPDENVATAAPVVAPTEDQSVSSVVVAAVNLTDATSMADFPESGRVYSVIVGSTQTRAQAEIHVDALPSLDYPVSIIVYSTDTTSGFRVGVGLFRTVAEANAVRTVLLNQLPEGSWVFRAQ